MIKFIKRMFHKSTPEERKAQGMKDAREFLRSDPSDAELNQFWSSAHVDRDIPIDGPEYARGAIEVIRPEWLKRKGFK